MHIMSTGLGKLAGGKLERTLKQMTSHPLKSLLLGTGVTAVIQSSSAVTVMLVGLVNSGIMTLPQTVEVIMGSNIGTTATAWLVSMVGIESSNVFIKLLKPENFSPVVALIGVFLIMASKRQRRRDIGTIMAGFAVLMYGMKMMANALSPLSELPAFTNLMTAFNNPLLGVLVGFLITGIIQSSSASVGILQALSLTGSITYGMALPIIMGQNIGTCVTAIISSFGVSNNAKRVAAVHISFNIIGTLLFLIVFFGLHSILHFAFMEDTIGVVGIALFHSAFNIVTSVVLLPFSQKLVKLSNFLVREKKSSQ
jgi:phosphate:Na+ symporter